MVTSPEKFTSQAAPQLLAEVRGIARREGREFEEVLEEAMQDYVEKHNSTRAQPEAIAHFRASLEKNRLLYELLAQ